MKYPGPRLLTIVSLLLFLGQPTPGVTQQLPERQTIQGSSLTAPPEIAQLLDPFRANPDSAQVARVLAEQAEASGFPKIALDHVLVSRLWRRANKPELALEALDSTPVAATSRMALLERARVLLESDTDRGAGVRAYWAACEAMDVMTRSEIEWDLLAVSTPEELGAWGTSPEREDCGWLRDFWNKRAQGMALTADDRVALHYRRLAHARDWYWIARPRFSEGWSDRFGRPSALPYDDRGLIYIRMGPPAADEVFTAAGGGEFGAAFPGDGDDAAELFNAPAGEQARCWPYWRPDGYRTFCFAQKSTSDVGERADGDYRIQQAVVGTPGSRYFQRQFAGSSLRRSVRHFRIGGSIARIGRFSTSDFLDDWQIGLDTVEVRAYRHQAAVASREDIKEVLQTVPDAPEVAPTVRFRFEALRFLNPSARNWQIWLLASVRAGDLTASETEENEPTLSVGGRYSGLAGGRFTARSLTARSLVAESLEDYDGITLRGLLTADPGPLPLTVVIEDLNAPGSGGWLRDTVNVPAIRGLPQLSDIAVAREEGGFWTRDGETFLQISPAHITNQDGSIYTYFEVYGLRPGKQYDVEVRLAPANKADRIFRLKVDDLAFRLQFQSEMTGQIGRHHLRLELGDTKPGEYTLAVRIQDADTRAYSLPAITGLFVAKR